MMEKVIGIDLGTTFSAVASIDEYGKPYLMKNGNGETLIPSVICYKNDSFIFGEEAKENQALGEKDIASFFKRSMGDSNFMLHLGGQDYNSEDLSVLLLSHLKNEVEKAEDISVKKAVITVPAYFSNLQREATIRAGSRAGLEVLGIINEPTAAAIAYGYRQGENEKLLVYDLGGGTFDVTLIQYEHEEMIVLATDGEHELGGKNWDDRIVNDAAKQFEDLFGESPLTDPFSFNELLVAAERTKKQLSTRDLATMYVVYGGNKLKYEIRRDEFKQLTSDLLERTKLLTESILREKELQWSDLDGVLLVGGSTKMPQVREWVTEMSGKPILTGIDVDSAVALGAAITAQQENSSNSNSFQLPAAMKFTDVMSHSLGMINENKDRSKYINNLILPKNKSIPCQETRSVKLFTQSKGSELEVYMTQGESKKPLENELLGLYCFSGIEKEKGKKEAILDISYAYDKNGVIQANAIQRGNGKILELEIKPLPDDVSWMNESPSNRDEKIVENVSVIFAIDLSGSMAGDPLEEAKKAALNFIKTIHSKNTRISLLSFANEAKFDCPLENNLGILNAGVNGWKIGPMGYGNSGQPFTKARSCLEGIKGKKILVVLTDGIWSNQKNAKKEAKLCHDKDIDVIALGFGSADENFLKKIASTDSGALRTDLGSLSTELSKIGQELSQSDGMGVRKDYYQIINQKG